MRFLPLLVLVSQLAAAQVVSSPNEQASSGPAKRDDNGYSKVVSWDKYSLIVNGQRIFVHGGEFHPFRLPVPDLWTDVLQKYKAAGLNAVSIYFHWGMSNPSKGVLDFDGVRALQPLLDAAKEVGLWVILRPGPYINAETSAGGMPHWVTAEVPGYLRTNSSSYTEAYTPYWEYMAEITAKNQITAGGPIILIQIDNEYVQYDSSGGNPGKAGYFDDLEKALRKKGVVIPTTYNDPGMNGNFVSGEGKVDIYGIDSYPGGFDCRIGAPLTSLTTNYYQYHVATNPSQPFLIPEFQSGSIEPWGPTSVGYERCRVTFGSDYESLFNINLWANNVKMVSYYMAYGGTSWGHIPFHKVYTSYDYGAAIAENRWITAKYQELKRQGLFLRSAKEFITTDFVGNSTDSTIVPVSNSEVYVTYLKNPTSGGGFYIARHTDSTSNSTVTFKLGVNTSSGSLQLPTSSSGITIPGRRSQITVTDFLYGSSRALYSTASILFAGSIGSRDVLYLYGDPGIQYEAAIKFSGTPTTTNSNVASLGASVQGATLLKIKPSTSGLTFVYDNSRLIIVSATSVADTFWSPAIAGSGNYGSYWSFGSTSAVLIWGPQLVRDADLQGSKLSITGDVQTSSSTDITIIAPANISSVSLNGKALAVTPSPKIKGILTAKYSSSKPGINLPSLSSGWKYFDSLPEIKQNYSDQGWNSANKQKTNSPFKPYYGDSNGPILYGCDYGFCEGQVFWKGHFKATGAEKGVNLTINGGEAFAASVWLNGKFVKSTYGKSTYPAYTWPVLDPAIEETDEFFEFPSGSLLAGKENVLTVLHDNMGLNETNDWNAETSKSPRGIRGYKLQGADTTFNSWKVQGKLGGYTDYPDKTRGVLNEGGFYAERAGYHLPALPTSVTNAWVTRSPSQGPPTTSPGVGFFRKEFKLDIDSSLDAALSFNFKDIGSNPHWRATLWVNGWTMGRVVGDMGPQFKFPVHEGILDYDGTNVVAVAIWALEPGAVKVDVSMAVDAVVEGGIGKVGVVGTTSKWQSRTGLV